MPGRYDYFSQMPNPAQFAQQPVGPDEQRRRRQADLMRFLGGIAPVAGAGIGGLVGGLAGGPAGIGAGVGIGSQIGGLAGQGLNAGADATTGQDEDRRRDADMRRQELLSVLQGMRR